MGLMSEFKTFINRGNVMDLAVGVIIGGAFATITKSLTDDLIMPVVGYVFGGADFSRYFVRLGPIPETFSGNPASYADLKAAGVARVYTPKDFDLTAIMDQIVDLAAEGLKTAAE